MAAKRRGPAWVAGLFGACALLLLPGTVRAQDRTNLQGLIDDLVAANHILYNHGVVDGYGHVSFRSPTNANRFYMAAAVAPGRVTAGDVIELDLDGNIVGDQKRPTYSERFIHAEIYRARPDVNSVIHTHSPEVIPFGVTGVPLRPIIHSASFLYTGVPVFDTQKIPGAKSPLVNDPGLGKALARTLAGNAAVLMRGHGDTIVAGDIRSAVSRAIYTELDARLLLQALTLGKPIEYISADEGRAMAAEANANRRGSSHGTDRIWQMWLDEASGKATAAPR